MKKYLRWYDYLILNANWFSLTTRSQVLTPLIIPLLVQQFVGEELKGEYVGIIRLWALMAALLAQAVMGMLSDRSTSRFGRRRPFIAVGAIGEIVVMMAIGLTVGLEGLTGFYVLFGLYIFSMLTSNTSHAATQGLIPDLVPDEKKGIASGIKALLELPVPLIFVSFVIGGMLNKGNFWGAIITLCIVLAAGAIVSMYIKETPHEHNKEKLDWKPFLRMTGMTAVFMVVILGIGELVKIGAVTMTNKVLLILITGVGMVAAVLIGVLASLWVTTLGEENHKPSFVWWVVNRLMFLIGATNLAGFVLYFIQEKFVEYKGVAAAAPATKVTMFVGIFILLVALPAGWLADKVGKKTLLIVAGVLAFAGTIQIILSPSIPAMYIGASLVGGGVGLFYSANWALGTEIIPKENAGLFMGLSNLAGAGAGAIGAYIGGNVASSIGYTSLMGIYGVLFLLSIITLAGIKEPKIKSA